MFSILGGPNQVHEIPALVRRVACVEQTGELGIDLQPTVSIAISLMPDAIGATRRLCRRRVNDDARDLQRRGVDHGVELISRTGLKDVGRVVEHYALDFSDVRELSVK